MNVLDSVVIAENENEICSACNDDASEADAMEILKQEKQRMKNAVLRRKESLRIIADAIEFERLQDKILYKYHR